MQQVEYKDDRILKARDIYNNGLVEQIETDSYLVKAKYQVDILDGDTYVCDCADYRYRSDLYCKHIIATQFYQLDKITVREGI